jgi:hypothetical protein
MDWADLLYLLLAIGGGVAAGLLHFGFLRRVTADYLGGNAVRALALQLARLALLISVLFAVAQAGAALLLAFAGGLVAGRQVIVRQTRRSAG